MGQQPVAGASQRGGATRAIWVPTLWVVLSSLRYETQPGVPSIEYAAGHPFPVLFAVLLVAGFAVLLTRLDDVSAFVLANPLPVFLYVCLGVSIAWSPFPWISFKRWVKIVGALGMVLIVVSERRPVEALVAVVRRLFLLIVPISLALVFLLPSIGREVFPDGMVTWVGVTPNRNFLGKIALLCAVTFTWRLAHQPRLGRRWRDGVPLLVCLFVIVGCGSVTSLVIYFAATALLLATRVARRDVVHIGGIIAYLTALAAVLYLLVDQFAGRTSLATGTATALGRDATLTGRVALWADLWGFALQRPLFGHGFSGFWVWGVMEQVWERHRWFPTGGHNGYLDVVLDTGFVGLAVFLAVVANAVKRIVRLFDRHFEAARLRLALLLTVLAHNLTESSFLKNDPYWVVLLFVLASGPHAPREASAPPEQAPGAPPGTGALHSAA